MDYNGYINGNKVIHCPTEELAKQVVEIAFELGIKWGSWPSSRTEWDDYKEGTCYSLGAYTRNRLGYGSITCSAYSSFEKVPAQEFISWYNNKFKKVSTEVSSIKLIKKSKLKLNFNL